VISRLSGRLLEKHPTKVLLDVGGVGYEVLVPLTVSRRLGDPGQEVVLWTHLQLREDALQLYGFLTPQEREAFLSLMKIRGVGGRLALNILSHLELEELEQAVREGNVRRLQQVPGIGRKTAQRLLLELGGGLRRETPTPTGTGAVVWPWPAGDARRDAAEALVQLGYPPDQALGLVSRLEGAETTDPGELVRRALAGAARAARTS
jgi:Holliday junction DNA helicase RuvA